MLRLSAGSLLALGLWPGALRAADEGGAEEFSFLAVNDTHYIDQKCGAWLQTVIAQMKGSSPKPELCLMSGDFTDDGTAAQLGAAREIFGGLGLPVYGVIGNHDWAKGNRREAYDDLFPNRLNYTFEHRGWQFMGLDTTEGTKGGQTKIMPDTLRWVEDHLPKLDRKRPLILISHFPLGPNVTTRPQNADALLERFKDHNLRAAFCGHYHAFTERTVGATVLTTDRCCSLKKTNFDKSKEKGYFLCRIKAGQISRQFVEVAVPA